MKISIIIPVYNAEKTLKKCVETVTNQSYKDLEIILVNDGSSDNSGSLCDELAKQDNRIKVIHKENGGASSARNAGIDMATGEFIQFVDADDIIEPQMSENLYKAITSNDSDLVICGYKMSTGGKIEEVAIKESKTVDVAGLKNCFNYLYKNWFINSSCNKLYKRVLIEHRYDVNKKLGEDTWFNLQYLRKISKVTLQTDTPYIYNIDTENSLTKIVRDDFFEIEKGQYEMITDFAKDKFNDAGIVTSAGEIFFTDANANLRNMVKEHKKSKSELIAIIKKVANDNVFRHVCENVEVSAKQHKIVRSLMVKKQYLLIYNFYKLKSMMEK